MKNIFTILLIATLLWPTMASGEITPTVVISKIAAHEVSDHEWLEITNIGQEEVDLSGWKFYEEKIKHGLSLAVGESMILQSGQTAIIADVATNFIIDYPDYDGMILDSSWTTLKEEGEEIGLIDKAGNFMEMFTYPAVNGGVLERIDLQVSGGEVSNWQNQAATEVEIEEVEEVAEGENISCQQTSLLINEFVADPADGQSEFIELYNFSTATSVVLDGWTLSDGAGTATKLSGFVEPKGFKVIYKPNGALNNTGDAIILRCDNRVIDGLAYGDWPDGNINDNAPATTDPNSVARVDFIGSPIHDWQVTTSLTPGGPNNIIAPVVIEENPAADDNNLQHTAYAIRHTDYDNTADIIITELLPNPDGSDNEQEFIEIYNDDDRDVDLAGWTLTDSSTDYVFGQQILTAGKYLAVDRPISKISLNNSAEEIKLISPDGQKVISAGFEDSAVSGSSWSLVDNNWSWTTTPTPNEKNILITANQLPTAIFSVERPRQTQAGEIIVFDASQSLDDDGQIVEYAWDFGDDQKAFGQVVEYAYATAGQYNVVLTVSDERGGQKTKKYNLKIYPSTTATSSTKPITVITDRQTLDQLPLDSRVKISATVSVPPKVFSSQVFYVSDPAVEIYAAKRDWPSLQIGDRVSLTGVVTESGGRRRIRLSTTDQIVVTHSDQVVVPTTIGNPEQLQDSMLVMLSGRVLQKERNGFWLEWSDQEILVVFKSATGLKSSHVPISGSTITVTGIAVATTDGWQIRPRGIADLTVTVGEQAAEEIKIKTDNIRLIKVFLAILLSGLGLWWWQKRQT